MEGKTGTLDIITADERLHFEWNGLPEPRAEARDAFDRIMARGGALATVWDAPHKGHQVRSFTEVEGIEQERGTVEVTITPQVRGG